MCFPRSTAVALATLLLSCLAVEPSAVRAGEIAKGADVGWLQQMVDPGQGGGPFQFYDSDGKQRDLDQATNCFKILQERHIDTIRFRVFVPPVTQSYWDNQIAGHCTIEEVAPVAAKAAALGLRILIDLHYSWTFADPGNQRLPVNWANEISGLSTTDAINKVASEVTAHTADVLAKLKAVGVTPEWVQVGNEITNGMLSETQNNTNVAAVGTGFGSRSNMPSFVKFINAGYDAVKAADPGIKVIIHIDRAHNDGLDKGFFSSLKANGGKWDVSGTDVSGGLFSDIQYTVNDLAASFNTPGAGGDGVMMCEIEPPNEYGRNNNQFDPLPDFDFVTNILNIMRAIPNGKGAGAVYWEAQADPDWRGYQQSAFANHEPSPSLDAFLPSIPRASGTNIIGGDGQPLQLKGVNLGGWLVMEPWMTPADSSGLPDEYGIIQTLDSRFGVATEQSLINTYRQNWINGHDLDNIKAQGMNVVRVPVWWGDFYPLSALGSPTAPALRGDAFSLLDSLVQQASERGIYTVIDMHGVFGGQSTSASTGQANSNAYWSSASNQANTQSMWSAIAAHYRGNAWVAGYDLLNEPDGAPSQQAAVTQLNNLYAAVRAADPDHLIFMEGTFGHAYKAQWGWGALPSPSSQGWTNVAYEMHEYQYNTTDANVQKGADNQVADFNNHKASYNVPCYIGEFNDFNYGDAWSHSVGTFNADGMSWSSWSYKATHGGGTDSWGLYNPNGTWTTVPNIATDPSGTISADWSKWTTSGTFSSNPLISGILIGPPTITSFTQAAVASGAAFAYTITATDSPTSFGATNLPAGLSINTATGVISGTPPANGGSFNIGLSAVTSGGTCAATLRLVVTTTGSYPTITSANAASGVVGSPFSYQTAVRNGPASFAATGLPAGLSVNTSTGLISGTPTAAGQTNVTLSATNGTGTATQGLALTIKLPAPVISSATSASGTVGRAFSYQITATNSPTGFTAGGLPAGLGVNTTSGLISGTPSGAGTSSVGLGASNAGGTGTATLTLNINNPPPPIPATPTGLTGFGWDGQVDLRWNPSVNATRYTVARSAASAGPFTNVGTNLTTTSFSDTGLANGATYYYIMSAGDISGDSAATAVLAVATVPSGDNAWSAGDIGAANPPGGATYGAGSYTLSSAGADIYGTADACQFMSQPLAGDGAIVARVASVSNPSPYAKAGVMIRASLAADAANMAALVSPGTVQGVTAQWRLSAGAPTSQTLFTGVTAPYWVKLVRAGGTFTAYRSVDGVSWTLQSTQTINMTGPVYAGLAVTAHNTGGAVCTATFDSVSIVPGPAWLADDLGVPAINGFAAYGNGALTVNGAGADIWGTSDQFRYVYQPVSGDCNITVRVTGVENSNPNSKGGVMIRETLAANSSQVDLLATANAGVYMQARAGAGAATNNVAINYALTPPYWLRLARVGNTVTGSTSPDGSAWTTFGSTPVTMGTSVYIGVAATSHDASKLGTTTMENISVNP